MGEIRRPTYTDPKTGARRTSAVWWIRYYRDGRRHEESAHTTKESEARRLLRQREGAVADGKPVTAQQARVTFDEGATDLLNDYTTNGKRSIDVVRRRVEKHLRPYFGGRRLASITTADVRAYIAHRQQIGVIGRDGGRRADVSNAQLNRELQHLKRIFSLALQAEKIWRRPHIPMLKESDPRAGFFEHEQFECVRRHLPTALRPLITFAYVTGWRVPSEVQTLQWSSVDFDAGTVTLDPGRTKNGEGRVFPFTAALRELLAERREATDELRKAGILTPLVFFRMVAKGRRGSKAPKPITAFQKAWRAACAAAGCPGRIPHDFRRTAVRNLVRAGVPERVAQQMTGHKTRSIFERYNITSGSDLRDAAAKLDAFARAQVDGRQGKSGESEGASLAARLATASNS
jgi:integrase